MPGCRSNDPNGGSEHDCWVYPYSREFIAEKARLRLDRFYRATRELGRVFKTEFILDYLSQPALRTRIRRGLLKGEQLHALARCVHYGRLGRLDQRDFERQTGAASCLLLILAAIICWQIREHRSCFERGGLGCGRSQLRVTVPYQLPAQPVNATPVLSRSARTRQPQSRQVVSGSRVQPRNSL